VTPAEVAAKLARAGEVLGTPVEWAVCPHGDGPPVCWCRKPLPGLGVMLIERHRLDPARCVYVGRDGVDQSFSRALGFAYRSASEILA
jgi:histidinol phosphatase-like enzyme